jgi:hypothetical protein
MTSYKTFIVIAVAAIMMVAAIAICISVITSSLEADGSPGAINNPASEKENTEKVMARLERAAWIFGLLVAVGVAGEAWYGVQVLIKGRYLRGIQKILDNQTATEANDIRGRLADAIKDSGEANERASNANKQAAIASKQAADAYADAAKAIASAAEAQLEIARIKYNAGQRLVDEDGRRKIVASLSGFAGQQFAMFVRQGTENERTVFASSIASALVNAGWKEYPIDAVKMNTDIKPYFIKIFATINIYCNAKDDKTRKAVNALSALLATGLNTGSPSVPDNIIFIEVNAKTPDPEIQQQVIENDRQLSAAWPRQIELNSHIPYLISAAGQSCKIVTPPDSPMADALRQKLFGMLKPAGWNVLYNPVEHQVYPLDFGNICVVINPKDEKVKKINDNAFILLNVLKAVGLSDPNDLVRASDAVLPGEILVLVSVGPFQRSAPNSTGTKPTSAPDQSRPTTSPQ